MTHKILVLPGDGIGPEIVAEAVKVLDVFVAEGALNLQLDYANIGGIAYDKEGQPYPILLKP